ncbi:unnamed protein product [Arabis nemorensis]|uniref:NYN domain-containing protein n=1 Tax=Arabis nemorensis TaxID=586526 RepID=A0A565BVN1_9BRAS|nr:unnamed protein product [Arabis nemorensis]
MNSLLEPEPVPVPDEPVPLVKYEKGNTGVFWNVEDYPIDDRLDSESLYQKMKEDLRKEGYLGDLSIHLFFCKDRIPARYLGDEQIKIHVIPDKVKKSARQYAMAVHVLLWAARHRPRSSNILLLSKNLEEISVCDFESLYNQDYGVVISDPDPRWYLPLESSTLLFPSLLTLENLKRKPEEEENLQSKRRSITLAG